jgi:hypothetical protein
MPAVRAIELPTNALLQRYVRSGAYTDCYVTEMAREISLAEFVEAFYTTRVFKLERFILGVAAARPSTDAQATQLGQGIIDSFAAWSVEDRGAEQLLLGDFSGRTKSWLMVSAGATFPGTRLYFGSAVVPEHDEVAGQAKLGFVFRALLGFHQGYSRVLLGAARSRLSLQRV